MNRTIITVIAICLTSLHLMGQEREEDPANERLATSFIKKHLVLHGLSEVKADKNGFIQREFQLDTLDLNAFRVFAFVQHLQREKSRNATIEISSFHIFEKSHVRTFSKVQAWSGQGRLSQLVDVPVSSPRTKVLVLIRGLEPSKTYKLHVACMRL